MRVEQVVLVAGELVAVLAAGQGPVDSDSDWPAWQGPAEPTCPQTWRDDLIRIAELSLCHWLDSTPLNCG